MHNIQLKKEFNFLIGKHNEISLEKYILKIIREKKKKLIKSKSNLIDKNIITKLKKEPEKNKTHWDILLSEMKWMQSDFEKERKNKKKQGNLFTKICKKFLESKNLEKIKIQKKFEENLKKKYINISRMVKNYWNKIEKVCQYNYNTQLNNEKLIVQKNRLMNFINKLQKISEKVANSLDTDVNIKINEQRGLFNEDDNKNNNNMEIDKNLTENLENNNNYNKLNENFSILVKKLPNNSYSHFTLPNSVNNSTNTSDTFDENILSKTAKFANSLLPQFTDLHSQKINLKQPFLLNNTLREYQLIGLNWLVALHDNHINGILADEMGLGKTIQTIALFAYLASSRGNWGPHLIIVPTTIIVNWEIEFKKWCPSFKILSYYGNQKERKQKRYGWHKPNSFHVCITSYKLVIQDYSIFKRKKWYYIVLDEAQNIKNFKSKRWQMLLNFHAKRKLLLTGTPLQNDIMEIWSYLHFLMPNLFYSNEEFREWFHTQFYNAIHNNASLNKIIIKSLHSILRPFLLRRLKKDVEKQLPEKIEHIVYCGMSRRQKYLYDEYINTDNTQDTLKKNDYFSIMNVLMQLRKVCNHPDLFDSRDYDTSFQNIFEINETIPKLCLINKQKVKLKNLSLILNENEKFNTYDYISMIKYFPHSNLSDLYEEFTKNIYQKYQPKYLIDEKDILFKKVFVDNSILNENNNKNIRENLSNLIINFSELNNNNYNSKIFDEKNFNNIFIPKFISPTNIPILQNNSLNNYNDIFYDFDTTENEQTYLKSVFDKEIKKKKKIKLKNKKEVLHTYDLKSRNDIVSLKPLIGLNGIKTIKLKFFMENINSPLIWNKIKYGEKFNANNYVIGKVWNNGFKYINSNKIIVRENNIVNVFEGKEDWKINEEEKKEDVNENGNKIDNNNINLNSNNNDNNNINNTDINNIENINNNNNINNENSTTQNLEKKQSEIQKEEPKSSNIKEEEETEDKMVIEVPLKPPIPFIYSNQDTFKQSSSISSKSSILPIHTIPLLNLSFTPSKYLILCSTLFHYFSIYIPKVLSKGPQLTITPFSSKYKSFQTAYQILYNNLHKIPNVIKYLSLFKSIKSPDRKLVEYDSGKLIKLSALLKKLYIQKSKVLIFTQMTRMLDILEIFLNIHGFTYVRLDGSTKVDIRQTIVDKFNNDAKVFCFISSTRSGGIGLNLTGADSIIFYDTDWNPAMDKQAQDRCHRIGQTRTVNIYRLITLSSIEENIFKKSIQKRELNYVVLEDGKFDFENVKKINIKNIVKEGNLIRNENEDENENNNNNNNKNKKIIEDKIKKILEFENLKFENNDDEKKIESCLIKIEDIEDVQAYKNLSRELLDEYVKENKELQFFKDDENKQNENNKKEIEILDKLKSIDKFSLNYYKQIYTYKQFVKEKESKMNINLNLSENEEGEDSIDINNESESENEVDKMDIELAYDTYLKKRKEIMRMFEQMDQEYNNNENEVINLN